MAGSGSNTPLPQRIFKIAIAVIAPVILLSLSITPIIQALNQSPDSMSRNQSEQQTERIQTEIDGYREVLKREPDNLVALGGLVERHIQLGQFEDAIDPLSHLVELQPEDQSLSVMLGSLLLQAGEGEKAVAQFQQLYAQQPDNPMMLNGLVQAQLQAGQTEQATALLQEKLDESPNDRDLLIQLAQVYRRTDRSTEAVEIYDRLIAANEEDFVPVLEKAVALSQSAGDAADPDQIESLFDRAISLAPPEQRQQVQQLKTLYAQLGSVTVVNSEAPTPVEGTEGDTSESGLDPADAEQPQ